MFKGRCLSQVVLKRCLYGRPYLLMTVGTDIKCISDDILYLLLEEMWCGWLINLKLLHNQSRRSPCYVSEFALPLLLGWMSFLVGAMSWKNLQTFLLLLPPGSSPRIQTFDPADVKRVGWNVTFGREKGWFGLGVRPGKRSRSKSRPKLGLEGLVGNILSNWRRLLIWKRFSQIHFHVI